MYIHTRIHTKCSHEDGLKAFILCMYVCMYVYDIPACQCKNKSYSCADKKICHIYMICIDAHVYDAYVYDENIKNTHTYKMLT